MAFVRLPKNTKDTKVISGICFNRDNKVRIARDSEIEYFQDYDSAEVILEKGEERFERPIAEEIPKTKEEPKEIEEPIDEEIPKEENPLDLNKDGKVDTEEVSKVASALGKRGGRPKK